MATSPRSGSPGTPRSNSARSCSSAVGTEVTKDKPYAEVESVKAVSDVVAPLSGEIVEVNETLADTPEQINEDPYHGGWMVKVRLSNVDEVDQLMDASAYEGTLI
jgi:glycine cleavage system H protein